MELLEQHSQLVGDNGGEWAKDWESGGLQYMEWELIGKMECWLEEGKLEALEYAEFLQQEEEEEGV